eukprot:jgi/Astpho2/8218/e_gw1.00122.65.1_t
MCPCLQAENSGRNARGPSQRNAFADRTNLGPDAGASRLLFSSLKGETHTHKTGFKQLFRRLRTLYRPDSLDSRDQFTLKGLSEADVVVFGCPKQKFTNSEFSLLKQYIMEGGAVLVLLAEGGEARTGTNINFLLEEFGMMVDSNCVIAASHHKYMHPKEVLVTDGLLNREMAASLASQKESQQEDLTEAFDGTGAAFVYPRGATLTVQRPAIAILGSGKVAFPMHKALGALWTQPGAGKLAVLGSAEMFDDAWLDREDNARVMDWVFRWLRRGSNLPLDLYDAEEPAITEHQHLPDTEALAEDFKACLQEGDEMPQDWRSLFDTSLYSMDTRLVPQAVDLYGKLGVKKQPLTLIQPEFEVPLPPLEPAVFPPALVELPVLALELFDLEDHFASDHARLGHLTNKCIDGGEGDLEFFVQEASHILGLAAPGQDPRSAKSVLAEILRRIVHYKSGAATGNTMSGFEQMQPPASAHSIAHSSRPPSALLS